MFLPVFKCPLCGSNPDHHHHLDKRLSKIYQDGRLSAIKLFFAICADCGMIFQEFAMPDVQARKFYNGQYRASIQNGDPGVTERVIREQASRVKYLRKELNGEILEVERLLDVGSSTGLLLKTFAKLYDCETLGIEPSKHYRDYCKDMSIAEDISTISSDLFQKFDLITMIHTLEHFANPVRYLQRLHDWARRPDCLLVVEVPNTYQEHSLALAHPVLFTEKTLKETLRAGGWMPIWIKTYKSFKLERPRDPNILALCKPAATFYEKFAPIDVDAEIEAFFEGQNFLMDWVRAEKEKAEAEREQS